MDEKKQMDNSAQLVKEAKEKLLWYIKKADEGELDEEAVTALLNVIAKWDEADALGEEERLREEFCGYCRLYEEEEKNRKALKSYAGTVSAKRNSGRIMSFVPKRAVAAAVVCILGVMLATGAKDWANAGEDTGFFHWLKKDKEGILAVTSPEKVGLEAEGIQEKIYDNFENVPLEYQQYLVKVEDISLLEKFELQRVECVESGFAHIVREVFEGENRKIRVGVLVYEDATMIARDKFENYEFLYTNFVEEREQDVYMKVEEDNTIQYLVSFYLDNRKYFVSGIENVTFLEKVAREYMDLVF